MPDQEFDIYLTMLSQLLRLQPGQREEIADELRDHLEERLAELTDAGVSHDDAVRRALEEFGDAAGLAADFTRISQQRTRRTLMRWTLGTAVVTTVAVFLATAFWPNHPGAPQMPGAKAQKNSDAGTGSGGASGQGGNVAGKQKPRVSRTVSRRENAELEKKLATKLEKVDWDSVMFKDVLAQIGDKIKVDIIIDKKHFSEHDYSLETQVTLSLNNTKVSARTALELAIERANLNDVAVTFRDGFVYLTGRDNDKHVEVYDCSSLLKTVAMSRFGGAGTGDGGGTAGGFGGEGGGTAGPMGAGGGGAFGPGGSGGPMPGPDVAESSRGQQLINVIRTTITSTDWVGFRGTGAGASIAEFNGMLVITASRSAHRDIKQLLERRREVATKKK